MFNCPKCNKSFEKARSLSGHISNCGKPPNLEKLNKMWASTRNNNNDKIERCCNKCGKNFIGKNSYAAHRGHCIGSNKSGWSKEDREKSHKSRRENIKNGKTYKKIKLISEETREKMRQSRFNYLSKRTGLTAWERKNKGLMSFGEKWLHDIFIKNNLYEKYKIELEYPLYPYFIDFAFIDLKIAVEFDGKVHKNRVEHDSKRDKSLFDRGWRTYRIKWEDMEIFKIEDLLLYLSS